MVLALLVGGYVALGLCLYGGVLVGPFLPLLLPCLLPLALVPLGALVPLACGCGCHQNIAPFQWRY